MSGRYPGSNVSGREPIPVLSPRIQSRRTNMVWRETRDTMTRFAISRDDAVPETRGAGRPGEVIGGSAPALARRDFMGLS